MAYTPLASVIVTLMVTTSSAFAPSAMATSLRLGRQLGDKLAATGVGEPPGLAPEPPPQAGAATRAKSTINGPSFIAPPLIVGPTDRP